MLDGSSFLTDIWRLPRPEGFESVRFGAKSPPADITAGRWVDSAFVCVLVWICVCLCWPICFSLIQFQFNGLERRWSQQRCDWTSKNCCLYTQASESQFGNGRNEKKAFKFIKKRRSHSQQISDIWKIFVHLLSNDLNWDSEHNTAYTALIETFLTRTEGFFFIISSLLELFTEIVWRVLNNNSVAVKMLLEF